MIQLPNGCYCTGTPADLKKGKPDQLPVFPKNWNSAKAPVKRSWFVHYRFYDPKVTDSNGRVKPKQVIIKGNINLFKTAEERQRVVVQIMTNELRQLKETGFNPITETYVAPPEITEFEVSPLAPFCKALDKAVDLLEVKRETRQDAKSVVKYVNAALEKLRYDYLPIGDVEPKHLTILLLFMRKQEGAKFTNAKWNRYRANLIMLFKRLKKIGAVKANYAEDIDRLKKVKKIRETLTPEQRVWVDEYLAKANPAFRRFTHIFYHSGGRETELMAIRGKNVNLKTQKYKCTVLKGTEPFEVERTIKTVALPFWKEALKGCKADDYVFSLGLVPGAVQVSSSQITRRWHRWVKVNLNKKLAEEGKPLITADFYSLKHSNTTDTIDWIEQYEGVRSEDAQKVAANQNAHKGTDMVAQVYDIRSYDRQHEKNKRVANAFVQTPSS